MRVNMLQGEMTSNTIENGNIAGNDREQLNVHVGRKPSMIFVPHSTHHVLKQFSIEPETADAASEGGTTGDGDDPKTCDDPMMVYKDYSTEIDPDPYTPIAPLGQVPNFPAKMHAILSRKDLAHIIGWLPHGRSWRVTNPAEFQKTIIPTYFGYTKFPSFQRQVNAWGFRRITRGHDVDSYCHPRFLRGLPHLCKQMKRCSGRDKSRAACRAARNAFDDIDLHKISKAHPVPEDYTDDSVLLPCTLEGGPKTRMYLSRTGSKNPPPKLSDFLSPTSSSTVDKSVLDEKLDSTVHTLYPGPNEVGSGLEGTTTPSNSLSQALQRNMETLANVSALLPPHCPTMFPLSSVATPPNHNLANMITPNQPNPMTWGNGLDVNLINQSNAVPFFAAGFALASALLTRNDYQ